MAETALGREPRPAGIDLFARVCLERRRLRRPDGRGARLAASARRWRGRTALPPTLGLKGGRREPDRSDADSGIQERSCHETDEYYHTVQRIGMGLVGAGFVGPHHIDAVRRLGFVDIVAVAGSSEESGRAKAE